MKSQLLKNTILTFNFTVTSNILPPRIGHFNLFTCATCHGQITTLIFLYFNKLFIYHLQCSSLCIDYLSLKIKEMLICSFLHVYIILPLYFVWQIHGTEASLVLHLIDNRFSLLLGCPSSWSKVGSICIMVLRLVGDDRANCWNRYTGTISFLYFMAADIINHLCK